MFNPSLSSSDISITVLGSDKDQYDFSGVINTSIMDTSGFNISNMELTYNEKLKTEILKLDNIPIKSDAFKDYTGTFHEYMDMNLSYIYHLDSMSSMFYGATNFNKDISIWNVISVTSMQSMFYGAISFNNIIKNWYVANVKDMEAMFYGATSFDNSLNNWNVGKVTNMNFMFDGATSFNRPLSDWNVISVTSMQSMFHNATSFNQNINDWDVLNVKNMEAMFSNARMFDKPLNKWDVGKVTNMSYMFSNARMFYQNINDWDVANVENMEAMFSNAYDFNQPLNNWNVSNVTNMKSMFYNTRSFNQPINNWDISTNDLTDFLIGTEVYNDINYSDLLYNILDRLQTGTLSHNGILQASAYYNYKAAATKSEIITKYGWKISDLGDVRCKKYKTRRLFCNTFLTPKKSKIYDSSTKMTRAEKLKWLSRNKYR